MTDLREEMTEWRNMAAYLLKVGRIHLWNLTQWVNRHTLKTYPLIEECARCRDCGRNVHDFLVPPKLWDKVIGAEGGVWCYDCFANRADEKLGIKWDKYDVEQFRAGMDVELEHGRRDPHTNVTDDDPLTTGKIALAHLNEFPDYYTRLEKMEKEADAYWAKHKK